MITSPLYSICVCNYNMASTLERSLNSLFSQVDSTFEIIVVDDGSTDDSLRVLSRLCQSFPGLVVIPLVRDSRRKLGETRNVSIRAARGKFVLLHIDADDIWEPFIPTFTKLYHEISKRTSISNFLLSGKQIQMAPKQLLLDYPYRNLYFGEDRVLWSELLVARRILFLNHQVFRTRIPLDSSRRRIFKNITSIYSSFFTSFALSPTPWSTFLDYLRILPFDTSYSILIRVYQLVVLPFAFLLGSFFYRHDFINQSKWPPHPTYFVNLQDLEASTFDEMGPLMLTSSERSVFFNN